MATWNYSSVIEFDRDGNSLNFSNSGNFTNHGGTLNDLEFFPTSGWNTFEAGDSFTFTTPLTGLFRFTPNTVVILNYVGTYTTGGVTYVILESALDPDIGFVFSPDDAATTDANLPQTISTTDPEFDGGDFSIPCFLAGTMIATPTGERRVENLQSGDPVLTTCGRAVPVRWIGRKSVSTLFARAERLMPVRLAAGSLGDGLPHSALTVTADHAIFVDGVLCNAGALVNGTTIARVPLAEMGESFTVHHIETDEHEVILANGAPAETFIDNVSRRAFDNRAEYLALCGGDRAMTELPLPRATSARQVPGAIRERLNGRPAA